jgi:dUTP pyrophosphatase
MPPVPIVQLDPDLPLPTPAHPGDAGLDLRARTDAILPAAGGRVLVATGIAIAIPPGFAGFVLPRSGIALAHGVGLANSPGLIDSAYRGEIKVVLLNTDPHEPFAVRRGERIAQLVVQRIEQVTWTPVERLVGIGVEQDHLDLAAVGGVDQAG